MSNPTCHICLEHYITFSHKQAEERVTNNKTHTSKHYAEWNVCPYVGNAWLCIIMYACWQEAFTCWCFPFLTHNSTLTVGQPCFQRSSASTKALNSSQCLSLAFKISKPKVWRTCEFDTYGAEVCRLSRGLCAYMSCCYTCVLVNICTLHPSSKCRILSTRPWSHYHIHYIMTSLHKHP